MTTVALPDTGLMGPGMARSPSRAGPRVTAWNRTIDKALPREEAVAVVAEPESAACGADVVVTVLFDAEAVEQAMRRMVGAAAVEAGGDGGLMRAPRACFEAATEKGDADEDMAAVIRVFA